MSETPRKNVVVAIYETHEAAEEAAREVQRSRVASNLTEFGETVMMRPSQPILDICDQRFLCRMAKRLGCHFCANE